MKMDLRLRIVVAFPRPPHGPSSLPLVSSWLTAKRGSVDGLRIETEKMRRRGRNEAERKKLGFVIWGKFSVTDDTLLFFFFFEKKMLTP